MSVYCSLFPLLGAIPNTLRLLKKIFRSPEVSGSKKDPEKYLNMVKISMLS
jgi:hypothetical protein